MCSAGTGSLNQKVYHALDPCVQLLSTTLCPAGNCRAACGWVSRAQIPAQCSVQESERLDPLAYWAVMHLRQCRWCSWKRVPLTRGSLEEQGSMPVALASMLTPSLQSIFLGR